MHAVEEIDSQTAPVLHSRIDEELAAVRLLVLDLSGVTFLGSSGHPR